MKEWKRIVNRNVRNGCEAGRSEISLPAASKPAACAGGPCTSSWKAPAWWWKCTTIG
ncbi:hypothetical protein K438DRAFT_1831521 [Mycena galopus ATCC 62051]|nr:hypothetical protein K438DRAFT_1831521 [Mycena galopus ATCC 62051]